MAGVIDPTIRESCSYNEALRCIHIGLLCVQEAPARRPKMSAVILMLNNCSMTLQVPSQPAYVVVHNTTLSNGQEGGAEQLTKKLELPSRIEVSFTDLRPR